MKIIDLLNKIANGEKVSNIIKYQGVILSYDRQAQDYYCEEYGNLFEYLINERRTSEFLNDEIEIIEEDKKIEKLENEIEFYSYSKYEELKNDIDKVLYILKAINLTETKISNLNNKLNEIIDKVNSLEKKQ